MSTVLRDAVHLARMGTRLVRSTGNGPELLVQFVTSRCDGACVHCFDWRRRGPEVESRDLTCDELERIARRLPPLYFVILTGGEPYLRDDFGTIATAYARHARPRILATPTNGGRPEAICATVDRILAGIPTDTKFSVNVSLDGLGALHDEVRNRPGLFDQAVSTIRGLQELARKDKRLSVGVVTVISHRNQDHIEEVMRFVLDDLKVPIWAPFLVRGRPRESGALDVDMMKYLSIARQLEQRVHEHRYREYRGFLGASLNSAKNVVRRRIIEQTVREGRRIVPCSAGRLAAVVYSDGTVHPCELLDRPMGNLRDFGYDLKSLWHSDGAGAARQSVDTEGCACTHENILTTSIAFAWRQWPEMLRWAIDFRRSR